MKSQLFYSAFFLFVFLLIFLPPYLASINNYILSEIAYGVFSRLCHQLSERSFTLWDSKLGVCARCVGIYFGLLFGCVFYRLINPKGAIPTRWILLASVAPLFFDGVTQFIGLRESTNLLRFITGFLFGVVFPTYLIPATDAALANYMHCQNLGRTRKGRK
ncbi:MAG: DUF2085 domain-containing protein [Candidatus Altiarchaeota archaeon]|nr:DUF2085 domain-containing protein [Candidatus Altiarchaeota archaeon]